MTLMEERIYGVIEAFQAGEAACFAADADVVDALGVWRRGRGEILPETSPKARSVSIRFLGAGDVALVHLGGAGVTTLVLSRTRGVWKIDAAHTSGTKGD